MADSLKSARTDLRVAVAGLGPIGTRVVEALDRGIDGLVLAAVSVQNPEKHRSRLAKLKTTPAVLPIEALSDVAERLGATAMQVALAWLLRRAPNILLIPGTSSVAHLRENLSAADFELPSDTMTALDRIPVGTEAA